MSADFFFKTSATQPAFSVESPIRAFEPTRPYPQNPSAIIYRVRFMQLRAYYTRPTANTPHPNLPQVYFADDIDFQDRTSGLMEWTRVYVTLPASWTDYESYAYNFPGYQNGLYLNRQPITKTVTSRLTEDYFLVGALPTYSTNVASGDNLASGSWGAGNLTQTANVGAIPACAGGDNYAAKLLPTVSNGQHYITQNSGAAAGPMSASVFVKSAGYNAELLLTDGGAGNARVSVDLNTGLILAGNSANATVAAVGDGWWRIGVGVAYANASAALVLFATNATGSNSFTADGSGAIYGWRAQVAPTFTIPHATIAPVLNPDATNYPVNTAGEILTKFGQQYIYSWNNSVAAYLGSASTPNYNTYVAWVSTDQSNANANSYSIEATDSLLSLWMGSVWARQRRFVKAR